ncbi:MAG: DUF302 domain-containing protein [bacterium]|nr:DUF302 domain-containing protein [bacterium]MDT8365505.1 DUF302 domain-containing protein [bacterium]
MIEERYYFKTTVDMPYDQAVEKVRKALAGEGFGVLTEIDVKATLKKKLDVDFKPYVILGACNPPLAYKTLQAEEQIGLMLPCNVVVQEGADGESIVAALNPLVAMESVGNPDLEPTAREVTGKLKRVIQSLV